jgi:Helix-turn-helix domain
MPMIGLKQAAEITGKDQSTIHRAMKAGKLSFTIDGNGQRLIDPAELQRWASETPSRTERKDGVQGQSNDVQVIELQAQLETERIRVTTLQERLAEKDAIVSDLRDDRDHWRSQAERLLITDQGHHAKPPPRSWRFWRKG